VDLSPISIKSLLNSHHPCGLMAVHMKYPVRQVTTLARIGGAGFRVLARFDHKRSLHYERIVAMWTQSWLPLDQRIGRGRSLNPYWKGCHY
jgi:hypothetical protein